MKSNKVLVEAIHTILCAPFCEPFCFINQITTSKRPYFLDTMTLQEYHPNAYSATSEFELNPEVEQLGPETNSPSSDAESSSNHQFSGENSMLVSGCVRFHVWSVGKPTLLWALNFCYTSGTSRRQIARSVERFCESRSLIKVFFQLIDSDVIFYLPKIIDLWFMFQQKVV